MLNYFTEVETIEDLKKQYRKLAKQFHPDLHDNDGKEFIKVNEEYEMLFKQINSGSNYNRKHNVNDGYRAIIDAIINLEGLEIELIGSWLWVGGNTYKSKEKLKEQGFKYSKKKKLWYWTNEKLDKRRFIVDHDKIRETYGSEMIKQADKKSMKKLA